MGLRVGVVVGEIVGRGARVGNVGDFVIFIPNFIDFGSRRRSFEIKP